MIAIVAESGNFTGYDDRRLPCDFLAEFPLLAAARFAETGVTPK